MCVAAGPQCCVTCPPNCSSAWLHPGLPPQGAHPKASSLVDAPQRTLCPRGTCSDVPPLRANPKTPSVVDAPPPRLRPSPPPSAAVPSWMHPSTAPPHRARPNALSPAFAPQRGLHPAPTAEPGQGCGAGSCPERSCEPDQPVPPPSLSVSGQADGGGERGRVGWRPWERGAPWHTAVRRCPRRAQRVG